MSPLLCTEGRHNNVLALNRSSDLTFLNCVDYQAVTLEKFSQTDHCETVSYMYTFSVIVSALLKKDLHLKQDHIDPIRLQLTIR